MPPAFRSLQQHLLKTSGGDRKMVDVLSLVLQHDEQVVLTAVELALKAGVPDQNPYPQCAASPDRWRTTLNADRGTPFRSHLDHRAAGQRRTL